MWSPRVNLVTRCRSLHTQESTSFPHGGALALSTQAENPAPRVQPPRSLAKAFARMIRSQMIWLRINHRDVSRRNAV
jgi:hypothetical protein